DVGNEGLIPGGEIAFGAQDFAYDLVGHNIGIWRRIAVGCAQVCGPFPAGAQIEGGSNAVLGFKCRQQHIAPERFITPAIGGYEQTLAVLGESWDAQSSNNHSSGAGAQKATTVQRFSHHLLLVGSAFRPSTLADA